MIKKNEPELIDDSFLYSFQNNVIPIQDKINIDKDNHIILNKIDQMNKEYITKKNKIFFRHLEKLYIKNIILKNKLNEVMNEKKMLNQLIIKLENKMNKIKDSKKENDVNNITNDNNSVNIELYKKKKRKRRKKSEIKNIYSCSFNNCNKKYPSKSSLNMHIKLKHQKQKKYNFDNEGKK